MAMEGTPSLLGSDKTTEDLAFKNLTDLTKKIASQNQQQQTPQTQQKKVKPSQNHASGNAPPLDTITNHFFDDSFNLCNPVYFNLVFGALDLEDSQKSNDLIAQLNDKFSLYLDTVEIHLLKEISRFALFLLFLKKRRSSSFFVALSTLQELHKETQSCVIQINDLRRKLSYATKEVAIKGLNVVHLKRRRGNLATLYGGVKLVSEITQTQPMITTLLTQLDFVGSLDLIRETTLLLRGIEDYKPTTPQSSLTSKYMKTELLTPQIKHIQYQSIIPRSLDLRGVRSLLSLNGKMTEMSLMIGGIMEDEFINLLVKEVKDLGDVIPPNLLSSTTSPNRQPPPLPFENSPATTWVRNIITGNFQFNLALAAQQGPTEAISFSQNAMGTREMEALKGKLRPLVVGLLRMDRLTGALAGFREGVVGIVKAVSKKYYPPLVDDAGSVGGSPVLQVQGGIVVSSPRKSVEHQSTLAKHLRSLSFEAFADLLTMVYITLLYTLQKIAILHSIIFEIVFEAQQNGVVIGSEDISKTNITLTANEGGAAAAISPMPMRKKGFKNVVEDDEDLGSIDLLSSSKVVTDLGAELRMNEGKKGSTTFSEIISESADIVYAASDLAHVRCSKLIGVRSEQNAQLNPKEFYRLFGATWEFVSGGEALNGRTCFGLKSTMLSQAKSFLNFFHEEKSKQLALLIENEQWTQAEVPIDFQRLTDQLLLAATELSIRDVVVSSQQQLTESASIPDDEDSEEGDLTGISLGERTSISTPSAEETGSLKYLVVDGQKFYAVGCLLIFLKVLTDYMMCIDNIPGLTNDVLNRILEVLKLFNSRLCQVILGAGAMRSAGLKNITARHIALATQALGVVIYIIPHLKTAISIRLPQKQQVLLTDFDRLLRDYREHQNELYLKLVSIMQERLLVHSKTLGSINWDTPDSKEFSTEEGSSNSMSMLVKETSTLHKVLAKYLQSETLKKIMQDVFKVYATKLEEELKRLDLFSSAGKNRLLIDVQYYIEKLSSLDGIDGPGNHMEVVVNNIKIKDKRTYQATSTLTQQPPSNLRSSNSSNLKNSDSSEFGSGSVTDKTHSPNNTTPTNGNPTSAARAKFSTWTKAFRTSEDNK